MSWSDVVLLLSAGLGAGLAGSIAGLASLISYPALLGVGLAPVQANVTNTVALVASGVGSALGSRPELTGQGPRIRWLGAAAVAGGAVGGAVLLLTPDAAFERIVPWLIGLASLTILVRPSPTRLRRMHHATTGRRLTGAVFAVGIYGGYFGAAAGVILFALLLATSSDSLARNNATKNVVLALANGVAAVAFALFGPVSWGAAVPLAVGFLVGGRVGPVVVRRLPAGPLRVGIAVAGLGLAVHLGLAAYR